MKTFFNKQTFLFILFLISTFLLVSCDIKVTKKTIQYTKSSIESSETWHENEIIELDHTVYVKANLTIEKCAEIHFMNNASIVVKDNGSIKTKGTASCPVIITSGKSSPSAGDWSQISIESSASSGNEFNYTDFEYGGKGYYGMVEIEKGPSVKFNSCTFGYSDSYGVFVDNEAKISEFSKSKFHNIKKALISIPLQTAGAIDKIESKNNKTPVVLLKESMTNDVTLHNISVPFQTKNTLYVKAKLTIDPGTTIQIDNSSIVVSDNGSIVSNGTKDSPVTFTSTKTVPSPGDWTKIEIEDTASSGNEFNYTVFKYGGKGYYGMIEVGEGPETSFKNCTFSNSKSYGLYLDEGANIGNFEGNSFDNMNEKALVYGYLNSFENFKAIKSDTKTNKKNFVILDGTLTHDITLRNLVVPYLINSSINIEAKLEVEAGTVFKIDNATISVQENGVLKTLGESGKRVVFTSYKSVPAPGDWNNITIEDSAGNGHELNYTTIEYGGKGYYGQLEINGSQKVTMNNVKFAHSKEKDCDISKDDNAVLDDTDSEYKVCK